MCPLLTLACPVLLGGILAGSPWPQNAAPTHQDTSGDAVAAAIPDVATLLAEVERNQKRLEAMQRDYTYHVHVDEQELDKNGGVRKTETQEAESLTIQGLRVNKIIARNGKPLSEEEQKKESERIDKEVQRAKDREQKAQARGGDTDERGNPVLPLSRILELGSFSNPRRVQDAGRSLIQIDYAGNPQARTHTQFENIMRDVVGTLWVDESERVLVRGEGRFANDFKLGGGLVADVRKGSQFAFRATRVDEGVWLPATIDGQGSVRVLLFAHFNGRMHVTTSDYRRFRTSATIVGSHGAIDSEGNPMPDQPQNTSAPVPGKPSDQAVPHP